MPSSGGLLFALVCFLLSSFVQATTRCYCRSCYGCTGCSATNCNKVGRALHLLEYLELSDQAIERQLAVVPPVIPCYVANQFCDWPHNNYCCTMQSSGMLTCGLGENWGTCQTSQKTTTKSRCDFDFACMGKGKECCGGLSVYNTEGPGECGAQYCRDIALQIVACNYVVPVDYEFTPDLDESVALTGPDGGLYMPTQNAGKYCGGGNRHNGRCKSSVLCCSAKGYCDNTVDSCTAKSISWSYQGIWVQNGGSDSYVPCGSVDSSGPFPRLVIGNGRCETTAATFGTVCCGVDGICGTLQCNGAQAPPPAPTPPSPTPAPGAPTNPPTAGEGGPTSPPTSAEPPTQTGNTPYDCVCANGVGALGTIDCTTCASCNAGFTLTSYNSCEASKH